MSAELVPVDGARLSVRDWGSGEPIVFVQTALTADELVPLARTSPLEHHRKIVYHRRGYAGSSAVRVPGSITRGRRGLPRTAGRARRRSRAHRRCLLQRRGRAPARGRRSTRRANARRARAAAGAHAERGAVPRSHRPPHRDPAPSRTADRARRVPVHAQRSGLAGVTEHHLPGSAAQMTQDAGNVFSTPTCPRCSIGSSGPPTPRASPVRCCTSGAPTAGPGSRRPATSCSRAYRRERRGDRRRRPCTGAHAPR